MGVNEIVNQESDATLDIDSVTDERWTQRRFPIQGHGKRNVVQVVIKRSVLEAIRRHGLSRTDVEVCGVLVGDSYRDERGPFVYVEEMIRGEHSDNKAAQVTFTSETWNHIQTELDQRHGEKRILGWYHTHPGFGIFLSAMDMFIHENFFNQSDQLALVYDPISYEDGLFVWREGQTERHQYLVEEDVARDQERSTAAKMQMIAAATDGDRDLPARLRRLERRNSALLWYLIASFFFAAVWPLAITYFDLTSFIDDQGAGVNRNHASPPESSPLFPDAPIPREELRRSERVIPTNSGRPVLDPNSDALEEPNTQNTPAAEPSGDSSQDSQSTQRSLPNDDDSADLDDDTAEPVDGATDVREPNGPTPTDDQGARDTAETPAADLGRVPD